jgi:hypothetical protein
VPDLTDSSRFADVAAFLETHIADSGSDASYDLLPGHPAIDWVGDAGCGTPDRDQDGRSRPTDGGAGAPGAQCDAGAIEAPYGGPIRHISGVVRHETDGSPFPGICIFAGSPNSNQDGTVGVTDADGRYSIDVPEGQILMAFFRTIGGATTPKECDGDKIDKSVQPEWYRNVAVQFQPAPNDQQAIFPDINDVTTVAVLGADVTGIDACLGSGPTAGIDAPCAPRVDAVPPDDAATPPVAAAPANDPALLASTGSGSGSTGSSSGSAGATPAKLASTGSDSRTLVPWALALVATGGGLAWCDRRRRRLPGA